MQALVIENTTYEDAMFMTNGFEDPLLHSSEGGDENLGGRKLQEGSVRSLGEYPGKKPGDWYVYQCVPMYNRDGRSKVTIITGGNGNCKGMWEKANDGCSSPVWSAYTYSFTPACQRHDSCKYCCLFAHVIDFFMNVGTYEMTPLPIT